MRLTNDLYIVSIEESGNNKIIFLTKLTPLGAFFNVFIYMIKETEFRTNKQTYMFLDIFPYYWYIVKINSSVVTCVYFVSENILLALFWGIKLNIIFHREAHPEIHY